MVISFIHSLSIEYILVTVFILDTGGSNDKIDMIPFSNSTT